MKTLIFEGAGWADADTSKATDVTNCRIRTRLRNNSGRVIYLEILCCHFENPKTTPEWAKGMNYTAYIDSVFYSESKATDVTNCRIRTRLRNNSGRVIYLEILCCHFENPKTTPEWAKGMNYTAYIDSVFYSDSKWDNNRNFSRDLQPLTNIHFKYNKDNILKFVNEKLNCSFDNIVIYNNSEVRVHNSEVPLCDCSNGDYIPYKDIEVNISELNGIKPIYGKDWYAAYKISYNSLMQLPYMRKYFEERAKWGQIPKKEDCKAYFRWDNNGIITDLELHAGVCMGVSAEDIQTIIDLIKVDNV